ncbi:MAG: hypothetical protein ABI597_11035 [Gammaproteobacteria bacterium]
MAKSRISYLEQAYEYALDAQRNDLADQIFSKLTEEPRMVVPSLFNMTALLRQKNREIAILQKQTKDLQAKVIRLELDSREQKKVEQPVNAQFSSSRFSFLPSFRSMLGLVPNDEENEKAASKKLGMS